jgi:hypothetical protein
MIQQLVYSRNCLRVQVHQREVAAGNCQQINVKSVLNILDVETHHGINLNHWHKGVQLLTSLL